MQQINHEKVLILGNGVSRKNYVKFIQEWEGEIWACNSAFLELANGSLPRLDRLIGDYVALKIAVKYKRKYRLKMAIYGKNKRSWELPGVQQLTLPKHFYAESGSTLVAAALYEGYKEVKVLGFDLGGMDLYVQHHERKDKSKWIKNWRKIANHFGLDRVEFIGKDHKPYILSNLPEDLYAKHYLEGKNHLDISLENI